jgi:UDP-N-acetylglucosamine 1-carboxyvinyltransferase
VRWEGADMLIDTTDLSYSLPSEAQVAKIRASSYLLGADLARFGICRLQSFGGCNFDSRPIDMHVRAMTAMGAVRYGDNFYASSLCGADIVFDKISVGATVNAILLGSVASGRTRIFGYAKEPHVISLISFLASAGADICLYEDRIEIVGARLHGGSATVIPDMIEAGTYAALSLITDSDIRIHGIIPEHLKSFFAVLEQGGASVTVKDGAISVYGEITSFLSVVTSPYPGFPTDLQPQMAPLFAAFCGGRITENVWKGRFGYLSELHRMGIEYEICDSSALIRKSSIVPAEVTAPDLRGGAALLICALFAKGKSVIHSSEIIKRGYSDVVRKLRSIGADISEED